MKSIVSVSVISANYNNGRYLPEFIGSIVNSTVLPQELIIIDDGSTDESLSVLDRISELNFLKVIRFHQNRGLTTALNAGLDVATGKYIMRADPDDLLLPERIERQFHFMEENPEIDVVGCNVIYFNDQSRKKINISNFPLCHAEIADAFRRGEHGLQHPTAFVKGDVFRMNRYQQIFPGEDYELFASLVKNGFKFANLPDNLYLMRVHPNSSTSNLKIEAIRQTFEFRDQIFGTKTSGCRIFIYYQYIRHYRIYQMTENNLVRYFHLFLSALFYPAKLFRRLRKK